jgi:hypothetical protein
VLIFIGDVPADAELWRTCPNFVGSHVAYVYTDCSEMPEHITMGSVHLNSAIAKRSGLSSFEPDVVTPYLKANLHWRVQAVRSFFAQSSFDALITLP